ncbi:MULTISPECIES: hypothetical protein, partial [unclassified Akkermansia]
QDMEYWISREKLDCLSKENLPDSKFAPTFFFSPTFLFSIYNSKYHKKSSMKHGGLKEKIGE